MKLIRLQSVISRYGFVVKLIKGVGEQELNGAEIAATLKAGDVIRLPGDGNSRDWDGCYSFKVLPNL